MIEFLNDLGINNIVIKSFEEKYEENILYNLKVNELEIEKIIRYFKEIGIKNIEDILLNKTEIFFKTFREIKNKFVNNDNMLNLVELINEDEKNIELLYK